MIVALWRFLADGLGGRGASIGHADRFWNYGGYVADDRNGRLKQFIDTGNKRGYVLYDEIERLLPENYEGGRKLDDLLAQLESAGVPILLEPADDPKTEKIYAPANVDPDDAVTVYLREVAKVPNLTKENEIELAK